MARVRTGSRRRTVWQPVKAQITVPAGESRVAHSGTTSSGTGGTPSATLVRTRGLVRIFNADATAIAHGSMGMLFTRSPVLVGVDVDAEFNPADHGSDRWPVFEWWQAGPLLASLNLAGANTFQYDPSPSAVRDIDSKGKYRVDGNEQNFAFIIGNDSTITVTVQSQLRLLWMLP